MLQLKEGDQVLANFKITSTSPKTYIAKIKKPKGTSLQLSFDGISDVQINYLKIQDKTYQAENYKNTASWSSNGGCGSIQDKWMYCNGSIFFTNIEIAEPKTTSAIIVKASGAVGSEDINLFFNDSITKSFNDIPKSGTNYKFTLNTPTISSMRVVFPASGPSTEDVTVDYISIDGKIYQTEDQIDNIGTWVSGKGCSNNQGETLHCPGRVNFDMNTTTSFGNKASLPKNTFDLYPNPTSDMVTINGKANFEIQLIDLNGRVVYQQNAQNSLEISVSDFTKGMYLVTMISEDERIIKKLVIQ